MSETATETIPTIGGRLLEGIPPLKRAWTRRGRLARTGLGITVAVFGIILIIVGVFILLVYGGFYSPPDATYVFAGLGVLLIILGLAEDVWAEERNRGGRKS
jgi:uncharacterized membrane protein